MKEAAVLRPELALVHLEQVAQRIDAVEAAEAGLVVGVPFTGFLVQAGKVLL